MNFIVNTSNLQNEFNLHDSYAAKHDKEAPAIDFIDLKNTDSIQYFSVKLIRTTLVIQDIFKFIRKLLSRNYKIFSKYKEHHR